MSDKKLVEITSANKELIHCAHCDGESKEVSKFYKELMGETKQLSGNCYLECCVDKIGKIVDWCDWQDYNTVVGKKNFMGRSINIKKGYS